MEYVTPPRGALAILNFFASEPDFANVVGDLSEEFQQRASAHGHPAAKALVLAGGVPQCDGLGKA